MALFRAYVPSRALLRALSWPLPLRCPAARLLPAQFARFKRTKAAKTKAVRSAPVAGVHPDLKIKDLDKRLAAIEAEMEEEEKRVESTPDSEEYEREPLMTDKELEDPDLPAIRWYEQDPDGTQRLVKETVTAEDRKRDRDMSWMIDESLLNPEYDDATLNRALMDDLAKDPNYADLTEGIQVIKNSIMSKEEMRAAEEQAEKDAEPEHQQFKNDMLNHTREFIQDLIDDPDVGDAKGDLQQLHATLLANDDLDDPVFQTELNKIMDKLNENEEFQKKMGAKAEADANPEVEKEWAEFDRNMEALLKEDEDDDDPFEFDTPEGEERAWSLLAQARDMLKKINSDPKLRAELDTLLGADSQEELETTGTAMDPTLHTKLDTLLDNRPPKEPDLADDEIVQRLNMMAKADSQDFSSQIAALEEVAANGTSPNTEIQMTDQYDTLPDDVKAKVDEIIQDPKFIENFMYMQKVLAEEQKKAAQLIAIEHETAPDPETLPPSLTATLKERTEMARRDPEHMAAMARLCVSLPSPFNIAPELRHFNQAIELAYAGANDDVRRILWRAYIKARSLPSFLESLSDDAWDIVYYSQAVKWQSNQNREHHLRVVLADLAGLGRNGPPTHPSTLVQDSEEETLER